MLICNYTFIRYGRVSAWREDGLVTLRTRRCHEIGIGSERVPTSPRSRSEGDFIIRCEGQRTGVQTRWQLRSFFNSPALIKTERKSFGVPEIPTGLSRSQLSIRSIDIETHRYTCAIFFFTRAISFYLFPFSTIFKNEPFTDCRTGKIFKNRFLIYDWNKME